MKRLLMTMVRGYRAVLSPLKPPSCRYVPTCSAYALEALELHGAIRGALLASRRICRCHPWGGHGYDPVPLSGKVTESARPAHESGSRKRRDVRTGASDPI